MLLILSLPKALETVPIEVSEYLTAGQVHGNTCQGGNGKCLYDTHINKWSSSSGNFQALSLTMRTGDHMNQLLMYSCLVLLSFPGNARSGSYTPIHKHQDPNQIISLNGVYASAYVFNFYMPMYLWTLTATSQLQI